MSALTKTLIYYVSIAVIFFFAHKYSPSGVCTPSLDFLILIVSIPLSFILLFISFYLTLFVDKKYMPSFLLHLIVFTGFLMSLLFS
jgi:hypothetical protein